MFSVWGTDNWQHTVYQHLWCSACAMFQILKYLWRTEIIKMTFVSWLFFTVNQTLWSDIASEITEFMSLPRCCLLFNKYGRCVRIFSAVLQYVVYCSVFSQQIWKSTRDSYRKAVIAFSVHPIYSIGQVFNHRWEMCRSRNHSILIFWQVLWELRYIFPADVLWMTALPRTVFVPQYPIFEILCKNNYLIYNSEHIRTSWEHCDEP